MGKALDFETLKLASLLHDIGKFWERTRRIGDLYPEFSREKKS